MKKGLLFVFCCFLLGVSSKAQYVAIPDSEFVSWLNINGYSQCMNGNQLDTTCSALLTADSIDCSNWFGFTDLSGIQFFQHLEYLNCSNNYMNSLSVLPESLKVLDCSANNLTTLPSNLPDNLTYLNCRYNLIQSLPFLPSSLKFLDCGYNSLSFSLGGSLPDSLEILYCDNNALGGFGTLSPSLIVFNCTSNHIYNLPTLPTGLKELICYSNYISSLPTLPDSLEILGCGGNNLYALTALPQRLRFLDCQYNHLGYLPFLNDSLISLWCNDNSALASLPELPYKLDTLHCEHTAIHCLPELKNVRDLYYGPYIGCLPSHPNVISGVASISTLPICDSNNHVNYCVVFTSVNEVSDFQFSIFPNPATTELNIQIDEALLGAQLNIYNITGAVVQTAQLQTQHTAFNIQQFSSGVYIAEVKTKDASVKRRWVKM